MESEKQFLPKPEIPKFIYHGSYDLFDEARPNLGDTPRGKEAPPRVYGSPNPAFAAAQGGFRWNSYEKDSTGKKVDCIVENDQVLLQVPKAFAHRLEQKVYIYKFLGDNFSLTTDEKTGHTWDTEENVRPVEAPETFTSVTEAVEYFGGRVEII